MMLDSVLPAEHCSGRRFCYSSTHAHDIPCNAVLLLDPLQCKHDLTDMWHNFSVKSAGLSSRSNWSGFLVVGFALDGHSTTLRRELQRPVLTCIVPHGARPFGLDSVRFIRSPLMWLPTPLPEARLPWHNMIQPHRAVF